MGLVNRPNDISVSRASQSQEKFKEYCGRDFAAKLGEFDYSITSISSASGSSAGVREARRKRMDPHNSCHKGSNQGC